MSMLFTINNSPFFGKDGKYVTSRHIRDRLDKELEKNLALRVESTDAADAWNVYGRGVLHLSVLIETMRREGYEMQVGQPRVIIKEIAGEKHEPVEELAIDLPDESAGKAIELVTQRRGELRSMERKGDRVHLEFLIPSRGIIGLRNNMMTATAGEAIMSHRLLNSSPGKETLKNARTAHSFAWSRERPMLMPLTNCRTGVNSLSRRRKRCIWAR
jgi:GTP-binding protein